MKQAKSLFVKAEAAAKAKDYLPSANLYLKAFALFPSPDFIFNAASMYRLAGDDDNASKYFKEYLSVAPQGRGASDAKAALKQHEAKRKEAEAAAQEADEARAADEAKADEAKAAQPDVEREVGVSSKEQGSENSMRLPAIIGMSAGGALVGVGIFFGVRSSQISDDVSKSPAFDPGLEERGRKAGRNAYIFAAVGAAAIVGSAVLYVLGNNKNSESRSLSLVPMATGQSAGALVSGQF